MSEIFIRKQEIEDGKTDELREWIDDLYGEAVADEQGVKEIWGEESLHTISLFIEHAADANYFVWYLEADSMEQLIEAREASTHPLHEVEDAMMGEVLVDPTEAGEFEPLMHGVSADRPDQFSIQQLSDPSR
ncbi:DUF6176 family protein [Haloarchaeobius salinus]|uniref:DUF6176 family protein n=1 Tax=Haloarchaeobius salinus TaxID=1198298 RepID=UPI00210A63C0|nr:DUF6176 family protein [Haloarchaeobius salinus]